MQLPKRDVAYRVRRYATLWASIGAAAMMSISAIGFLYGKLVSPLAYSSELDVGRVAVLILTGSVAGGALGASIGALTAPVWVRIKALQVLGALVAFIGAWIIGHMTEGYIQNGYDLQALTIGWIVGPIGVGVGFSIILNAKELLLRDQ